jgi:hypothetical protein
MKLHELLEAKELAPWVRQEELSLRDLLKRFGFTVRQRPFLYKDHWTFGGAILDIDDTQILSVEKRVAGLQRALAKHLANLRDSGRDVTILVPARFVYSSKGELKVSDFLPKQIYKGDNLMQIELLVQERVFLYYQSGIPEKRLSTFYYGVSTPTA